MVVEVLNYCLIVWAEWQELQVVRIEIVFTAFNGGVRHTSLLSDCAALLIVNLSIVKTKWNNRVEDFVRNWRTVAAGALTKLHLFWCRLEGFKLWSLRKCICKTVDQLVSWDGEQSHCIDGFDSLVGWGAFEFKSVICAFHHWLDEVQSLPFEFSLCERAEVASVSEGSAGKDRRVALVFLRDCRIHVLTKLKFWVKHNFLAVNFLNFDGGWVLQLSLFFGSRPRPVDWLWLNKKHVGFF